MIPSKLRRILALSISAGYWTCQRMRHVGRRRNGCVVLYYHGVPDAQASRFARQMEFLSRNYLVIPLREATQPHSVPAVCLTFDDAMENLVPNAIPVLQRLGLPATIFAVSENLAQAPQWDIDRAHPDASVPTMSADQLRALPADLFEIGSHTCTHPHLPRLMEEKLEWEFVESKRALERLLGREVRSLSIPFGECHPLTSSAARKAGYDTVVTCEPTLAHAGADRLHLGRFKVDPTDWMIEFRLKAAGAYAWRRFLRRSVPIQRFAPKPGSGRSTHRYEGMSVLVDCFDSASWSRWASFLSDYNVYHTWSFGEQCASDTRCEISRLVVLRDQRAIGMAQLRIKRIPLLGTGIAYCYGGPICQSAAGASDVGAVLQAMHEEYVQRRGLVLRIVPRVFHGFDDAAFVSELDRLGFSADSAPPQRTVLLDLRPSLEQLRAGLDQKWRNGLNQSLRKGVSVKVAADDLTLERFESLYRQMWGRKRFTTGVSVRSFRELQARLSEAEKLTVMLAEVDGSLAAAHVSSTLGDTCIYLLGASNELGRSTKASYLLQWKTLEHAKAADAKWYDLGGIDAQKNPGVYHFKSGLGGREAAFIGSFSLMPKRTSAALLPFAEHAYRSFTVFRKRLAGDAKVAS